MTTEISVMYGSEKVKNKLWRRDVMDPDWTTCA